MIQTEYTKAIFSEGGIHISDPVFVFNSKDTEGSSLENGRLCQQAGSKKRKENDDRTRSGMLAGYCPIEDYYKWVRDDSFIPRHKMTFD